jgi:hypothetical protein
MQKVFCDICKHEMIYADSPFQQPPISSATDTSGKVWLCPNCGAVLKW